MAVTNFLKNVETPKSEDLKAFFEKYKEIEPKSYSPEPGFRCPEKITLEYFTANLEKFSSPEAVTEADIQKHYAEKNDFYDQWLKKEEEKKLPEKGEKGAAKDSAKDAKETKKEADAKDAKKGVEEPVTPKLPEEKKDAPPAVNGEKGIPQDSAKDAKDTKKEGDAKDANKGTEEKGKATSEPKDEKTKEPEKPKDSGKSSSASKPSPFVLTSLLQEENKQPPEKTDKKPETKPEAVPEAKPETKPEVKPEAKPDVKPEVKPEAKPEVKTEAKPDAKPEEKAKEAKPSLSDELKKRIRRDIAYEKTKKIFDDLTQEMNQHGKKMKAYEVKLIQYRAKGTPEKAGPLPAKLDFEGLAKKYGLTSGRLEKITIEQARDSAIGDSIDANTSRPLWIEAFKTLKKFEPERSVDNNDNLNLLWITEDVKEHVPDYDDPGVRDDVLHTWKVIHAREDALKEAKALADKASKAGKSLKQVFADRPDLHVILPTPFTWMTMRSVAPSTPEYAQISPVAGVELPGQDFMRAVFRLKPGEVGAAMNAPGNHRLRRSLERVRAALRELLNEFASDSTDRYASTMNDDQRLVFRDWLKEIKNSAGFEWAEGQNPERTATAPAQDSEPGPMDEE